tara:strand:- start:618 stop:1259 length:642 start_codon:yes stop_codon:yes gene_type:complete
MEVKIKKEGKKETYNLIDSWSDVTLEKWMQLSQTEEPTKTEESEETIAALSDLPRQLIKELALRDVVVLTNKIAELQEERETTLRKVIEIDGIEYGMHPDLSEITLGEYADIETLIKEGIQQSLPELMAILFRPIIERNGDVYVIEAYDGNIKIRAEIMKKMQADQVQSCLVFFWHFVRIFLKIMPYCLLEQTKKMIARSQMETLQHAGAGME